ncbi:energy-coupling factor transporter transmembrane component T [Bifidobacterium pseudolongum]|uniref:Cobalt transporter n=1 Tax=Bifidobacterium pseudolongum subsp. globosum TaxID=1690 RepID=A0A2N3QQY5_9BIFI|nr:energy-coupling factor transporter transmembrane component T [Bifidobacterium pseudolongum]PKU94133.1 cobalt transporter [Bifidobacterium pseudolongum subsp. globosum]PKV01851.1 cobalt transporter [Bifidobacterium pseudolongum subsp. globosum]RYQ72219.1 cobalt transporter [Bifidobacterium pseudolongum subsp. globosum]RYQ72930.1 cobalt transporter [Bifidobacterium pseudolongum subsp. globosum]
MEKAIETKEITGWLHLDPRTKLAILVLFSVVVMIDVVDGPAYIIRVVMTFIPVLLVCLEGKIYIGARFTLLYLFATCLMQFTQKNIHGVAGMLLLFVCYMIMQFAPTMITVWYCISTTKISEFMAAMSRMHVPQGIAISIAVMMRFFPTLGEEYRSINDAMRMRGISFGGGKVTKMVGYRMIPLLFSTINIGDELSQAAVTRGLGSPMERTNISEIGFHARDFLIMLVMLILTVLYVYFTVKGGNVIL